MTGKLTTNTLLSPGSRAYWERRGLFPAQEDRSLPGLRLRRFLEECLSLGFRPARLMRVRRAALAESRELHQLSVYGTGEQPLTADLVVREQDQCYEPGTGQQFFRFGPPVQSATIARFPDDVDFSLERLFADNPSADELEQRLGSFVEDNPHHRGGLIELGNALFAREDYEGSAILYRRCLEVDPDCAEACYNLAGCHVRKREYAAAIRLYHRSVRLRPEFPEALYSLGVLYLTLNYRRHAKQTLQAVVAIGEEDWAAPARNFLRELEQPTLESSVPGRERS